MKYPLEHSSFEAANWMFKGVAITGCLIASVDDFKNGTLEIFK